MQILVIDDSRTMRKLVLRTLRQAGFGGHDIIEAGDGVEGYEAIRDQGPDIVLCDWNMPRMSGIDLLRQLRSSGDQRPFGFVTSEGTPEMREIATKAGAQFLISKPFTAEIFSQVLGGIGEATQESPKNRLPTPSDAGRLVETLLGRSVDAREALTTVDAEQAAVVWSYVFPDGSLAAAASLDLTLAAVLGAGFGLLPPGRVGEALENRNLAPDIIENLQEVVNVLVALYTPHKDDHMRLGQIYLGGHGVPADVQSLLASRTRRFDAVIKLSGYGEGVLSAVPSWRLAQSAA